MAFDLLTFLGKFLSGFSVPDIGEKVQAWLEEKGAEYPDLKDRTAALAAWLEVTLADAEPELDPATAKNTLLGIASDIVHGVAGVDPGAWHGGV